MKYNVQHLKVILELLPKDKYSKLRKFVMTKILKDNDVEKINEEIMAIDVYTKTDDVNYQILHVLYKTSDEFIYKNPDITPLNINSYIKGNYNDINESIFMEYCLNEKETDKFLQELYD